MAEPQTGPAIEATDLTRTYGSITAVDGISFEVRSDEIFALVGPNGAGKTVTVEMLECLRTPTSGSATVLGFDVEGESREIKARIGVVPQSFHTFERLTVRENIELIRGLYSEGLDPNTVIDRLDLAEYADTRFSSLSGGWQRRTGIAMALVSDPEILFLDEPTTGLDPSARRMTWGQIDRLAERGTTIMLTTHYMEEVEELADRAALLVDGALEAVDTVSNLIDEYGGNVKLVVSVDSHGGDRGVDSSVVDRGDDGSVVDSGGDASGDRAPDEIESVLRAAATDVYHNETGDLVGLFDDRTRAQDTFGDLHDVEGTRSIELVSSGMEDVFLRLAGGTPDPGGELRPAESPDEETRSKSSGAESR
jgi:ABC-2 type transport system ATP-binding protein